MKILLFITLLFLAGTGVQAQSAVQHASLKGRWKNDNIILKWQQLNGHNAAVLEKSVDGVTDFRPVKIPAGRSRRFNMYSDKNTRGGNGFYYRLKWLRPDGGAQYSPVVRFVKNARNLVYTFYPQPGNGVFSITINNAYGYAYRIAGSNGLPVTHESMKAGENRISMSHLPAGVYYVQVLHNNKVENTYKVKLILK